MVVFTVLLDILNLFFTANTPLWELIMNNHFNSSRMLCTCCPSMLGFDSQRIFVPDIVEVSQAV